MNNKEYTAMPNARDKSVVAFEDFPLSRKEELQPFIEGALACVHRASLDPADVATVLVKALARHMDGSVNDPDTFRQVARVLRAHAAVILAERC